MKQFASSSHLANVLLFLAFAFVLTGCTFMYSHAFHVEPSETLSQDELHKVFVAFKDYLAAHGMKEIAQPANSNPDYAAFEMGGGYSGILHEPFEEYLELSYTPDNGFVLKITRVISHPIDFSDQYIAEFISKTEQFIHEATSKHVRLQIIQQQHP